MQLSTLAAEASPGTQPWGSVIGPILSEGRLSLRVGKNSSKVREGFMAVILEKLYPFLAVPHGTLAVKACSLTHWTAKEFPRNDDPPHLLLTSCLTARLLTQLYTLISINSG